MALKQFRSHKIVHAAKIVAVHDGKLVLQGEEGGPFYELVDAQAYFAMRVPSDAGKGVGGYLVVYSNPDGSSYESWSPADAFESGYHPLEMESYEALFQTVPNNALVRELNWRMAVDGTLASDVERLAKERLARVPIADEPTEVDVSVAAGETVALETVQVEPAASQT